MPLNAKQADAILDLYQQCLVVSRRHTAGETAAYNRSLNRLTALFVEAEELEVPDDTLIAVLVKHLPEGCDIVIKVNHNLEGGVV